MNAGAALTTIKELAAQRRVLFTVHAMQRMDERRVSRGDVFHAISIASACTWDRSNVSWVIGSEDLDGDALVVAAVIDGLLVIKTVY